MRGYSIAKTHKRQRGYGRSSACVLFVVLKVTGWEQLQMFQSMSLDITDVIARSHLYPHDKKYPYGYCTNRTRTYGGCKANIFPLRAPLTRASEILYSPYSLVCPLEPDQLVEIKTTNLAKRLANTHTQTFVQRSDFPLLLDLQHDGNSSQS